MEAKTNGNHDDSGPCPRLCHLIKWPDFDGYGFNLHAEKAKSGQYIGKVDADSPAELAGLREGDRIIEVNLVNISNENHRQVVERIKSIPNETKLLVVDELADKWYKERKIVVKSTQSNVIHYKTPVPRPVINNNNNNNSEKESSPRTSPQTTPKSSPTTPTTPVMIDNNQTNQSIEYKLEVNGDKGSDDSKPNVNDVKTIEAIVEVNPQTNGSINSGHNTPILENGANSSRSSTPKSVNRSLKESTEAIQTTRPSSSGSHTNVSIPDSPTSSKSGSSLSSPSRQMSDSGGDLNLNMSASQMRQMLAQRKKMDAKKAQMDLKQKYEIIQQM